MTADLHTALAQGGGASAEMCERAATFAAVRSYRAVYRNEITGGVVPIVDALRQFWLDRFREGHHLPERFLESQEPITEGVTHMKFDPFLNYVVDGQTLGELRRATERLNDGMALSPDQRRDLAQVMQALLDKAMEFRRK